jgi:hypothetical protein
MQYIFIKVHRRSGSCAPVRLCPLTQLRAEPQSWAGRLSTVVQRPSAAFGSVRQRSSMVSLDGGARAPGWRRGRARPRVTATQECPSGSETVCSGTPAASMCVAAECLSVCLSVCRPTPLMPKALAAVLIARSAFLGSTAVPRSVVNTRTVSTQIEAALTRSTASLALTHPRAQPSRGRGARRGVSAPSWAH